MRSIRRSAIGSLAITAALLVAACSGGSDGPVPTSLRTDTATDQVDDQSIASSGDAQSTDDTRPEPTTSGDTDAGEADSAQTGTGTIIDAPLAAAPLVTQLEQGEPYRLLNLIDGEAFDLFTPEYATATRRAPSAVAWSPDATSVAYLDVLGVTIIAVDGTRPPIVIPAGANAFAWSPDAALIAVAAEDGVALYRPDGSFEQRLTEDPVTNVRWSSDGSMIAYRPSAGQLRVWQAGEEVKLPTNGEFFWLPDGRILLQRSIIDPATPTTCFRTTATTGPARSPYSPTAT